MRAPFLINEPLCVCARVIWPHGNLQAHELQRAPFPIDLNIPVVHKLMIKQLLEDDTGAIFIVGTMVHHQVRVDE